MCKDRECHHADGECCGEKHEECRCNDSEKGCSCHGHFQRRYQTREEESSCLEAYLSDLKLEVQAVEERLNELKK